MTDHKTILDLIETVDPADTAKLDEIDARVWCYINKVCFYNKGNHKPESNAQHEVMFAYTKTIRIEGMRYIGSCMTVIGGRSKRFTRSRDALKAIRPDGWGFRIDTKVTFVRSDLTLCDCSAWPPKQLEKIISDRDGDSVSNVLESTSLKTEELAELHAIIQAIAYERGE